MKFEQFQFLREKALTACAEDGRPLPPANTLNPILLAYIGDAVFSLYIRMRLLPVSGQVRVIHNLGAQMVSAVFQAKAIDMLQGELSPEEQAVAKRGRNTKSAVPKSATVDEYRRGTAFECLVGWLFLENREERLEDVLERSFSLMRSELKKNKLKKS